MIQHLFCPLPLCHILTALNFITKNASFAIVVRKYFLFSVSMVVFCFELVFFHYIPIDLSLHLRSTAFTVKYFQRNINNFKKYATIVYLLSMNFILQPGGQWPVSSDTFFLIKGSRLPNVRFALLKKLLKIELFCLEFFCSNPSHNKTWYIFSTSRPIPNIEIPHVAKIILTTSFSSQPDQSPYKSNYFHIHSRLHVILKSGSKGVTQAEQ